MLTDIQKNLLQILLSRVQKADTPGRIQSAFETCQDAGLTDQQLFEVMSDALDDWEEGQP